MKTPSLLGSASRGKGEEKQRSNTSHLSLRSLRRAVKQRQARICTLEDTQSLAISCNYKETFSSSCDFCQFSYISCLAAIVLIARIGNLCSLAMWMQSCPKSSQPWEPTSLCLFIPCGLLVDESGRLSSDDFITVVLFLCSQTFGLISLGCGKNSYGQYYLFVQGTCF